MKPVILVPVMMAGLIGAALANPQVMAGEGGLPTVSAGAKGDVPGSSPATASDDSGGPVAVPPPSEKALRYHRSGNVIWTIEQALGLALPALLLFTGLSARLRTFAAGLGRGHFYPTLVIYLGLLSALLFLIQLPLSYYVGFAREHAYGLSTQRFGKWAGDGVKGL